MASTKVRLTKGKQACLLTFIMYVPHGSTQMRNSKFLLEPGLIRSKKQDLESLGLGNCEQVKANIWLRTDR